MTRSPSLAGGAGKLGLLVLAALVPYAATGEIRAFIDHDVTFTGARLVLALLAFLVILLVPGIFHTLARRASRGPSFVVAITCGCAGAGILLSAFTHASVVLVAFAVAGFMIVVNPELSPFIASRALAVHDGARFIVSTGVVAGIVLVVAREIVMYSCPVLAYSSIVLLVVFGTILPLVGAWKAPAGRPGVVDAWQRAGRFRALAGRDKLAWISNLLAWCLFPVVVLAALRDLGRPGSFGSGLSPVITGWLSIITMAAGAAGTVAAWLLEPRVALLPRVHVLVSSMVFTIAIAVIVAGGGDLVARLVVLAAIPGTVSGVFSARVPLARSTGTSTWRVTAAIGACILFVVAIAIADVNEPVLVTGVFVVTGVAWCLAGVVQLARRGPPLVVEPAVEDEHRA